MPGAKVETQVIDLSDLESVRSFTQRALAFPGHQLDVLLNNAGDKRCASFMLMPPKCQLCKPIDTLHIWRVLQASWRRQRCRQRRDTSISSVRPMFCMLRLLKSCSSTSLSDQMLCPAGVNHLGHFLLTQSLMPLLTGNRWVCTQLPLSASSQKPTVQRQLLGVTALQAQQDYQCVVSRTSIWSHAL